MSGVPGPVGRIAVLLFTPIYLVWLAAMLSQSSGCTMVAACCFVFAGTAIIMTVIALLCGRFANHEHHHYKFSISTLMLLTVPMAIYCSYIGQIAAGLPTDASAYGSFIVFVWSIVFMFLTSILLIRFTDAVFSVVGFIAHIVTPRN